MSGKLYVVGTPIGNLGDMTFRAVETLKSVDFIAAEDTRVTGKLLSHFDIKKPMMSYHEHNRKYVGEAIVEKILGGSVCAVVTDAGMPCISDPGEDLVKLCAEKGVPVEVVPGPSAAVSALAVSGLDTKKFVFEGFLSTSPSSRKQTLESVVREERTLIFYEAPHKLVRTLGDLLKYLGDRRISLCRELTKIHEQVIRTTLSKAVSLYDDGAKKPVGEFVLIVEGYKKPVEAEVTFEDALLKVRELVKGGKRGADACREVAKETGYAKSELYAALVERSDGGSPDKNS